MTIMEPALTWRRQHEAAELPRSELWARLRDRHRLIGDHAALIAGTEIAELAVSGSGLVARLDNGLAFNVDPDAVREAPNIILAQGSYELFEKRLLLELARDAKVVLDVGANIGWYSLHIAAQESAARIYAFEPVPMTYAKLTANVALNRMGDRVIAVAHGLSDKPGAFEMFLPGTSGSPAASLSNLHPTEESRRVTAHFSTMDAFVAERGIERVDLLKCDVEGAELMVLKGGEASLARFKPAILIELLRKWSAAFGYHPNDVLSRFHALGYGCWGIEDDRLIRIDEVTEATIATNYVFLHPERHRPAAEIERRARG